jgi:uncharacterized protein (DUF885 family)
MHKSLTVALAAMLVAGSLFAAPESLQSRRKALEDVIHDQWEYTLKTTPEWASLLGDKRYNDQLSDPSEKALREAVEVNRKFLTRLRAIDASAFPEQERISKDLLEQNILELIEEVDLKTWEMPVTQFAGLHLFAAQLPAMLSFTTIKDYDDYIKRMRLLPTVFDRTTVVMRKGMADHLMPPRFLLEKVASQTEQIAKQAPDQTPFAAPFTKFPESIPAAEQTRLRTAGLAAIRESVLPAYARFVTFVRDDYAPKGRTEVGMWALPNGQNLYAARVHRSTTTNLKPEEIHQIGLREVARIETEMLAVAKKLGFEDLKSLNKAIEANPALRAKSRELILDIYRGYETQMYAQLPKLFGRLPKAKLEVVAIPEFREKSAAGADYDSGAADGSRPGRINVNTGDPTSRKTITMESTAYHEGVPGHHMQIAIAQELEGIPAFRREGGNVAYVEGWALYSEKLGKEVGFYQDPYNDYGRLQDEMLRAIRLVVDTGLHYKKWTREQVVQFFHDHSAIDEVDVQAETDRYIVIPGQALGYKIGQLKITELRERARKELGDRFDIRQFHDEVLGAGALPLDMLEQRINNWIAQKKKS